MTYSPQSPSFSGQIEIARIHLPEQTLEGTIEFRVTGATGEAELLFSSGTWSGPDQTSFGFEEGALDRDGPHPSHYIGFLFFLDLSDPPAVNPDPPQLSLMAQEHGFLLTLTGAPGATYMIESTGALSGGGDWAALDEITLEQPSAAIPIETTAPSRFFRARLK